MAAFCTECGTEIPDGAAFCSECGTKAPVSGAQPAPQVAQRPIEIPADVSSQQTDQAAPHTTSQPAASTGKEAEVASTGYFFGMTFLYAIPAIGWIVCLLVAFTAKNRNKKNHAKATLIWIIIGIALTVIAFFVLRWLGGMLKDLINTEFSAQFEQFGQFGDLNDLFEQFQSGGLNLPVQ